ncbi:hypothetical protein F5Y05DRAFT_409740 [Hypoxylon sp. FL0543]|nr:hypothetical protein F5Y05DRAFT_409740 [Hypoxylon sp. FL0543]
MKATSAMGILVALMGMTAAAFPFGRVRDIGVRTLAWGTLPPSVSRERILLSPPPPAPRPLPHRNQPSRRQDSDRGTALSAAPDDDAKAEDDTDNHPPADTATQPSQSTVEIPAPTPRNAAEERGAAKAGLVVALGAAFALLA